MASHPGSDWWVLEVVKGRDLGRKYPVARGEHVLGNELNGTAGINLADQEPDSPRRMAGQQASLTLEEGSLVIRDLASPGGTFVNRQRLLSGQARPLSASDLIQLGSVQLQVKREAVAAPRPSTAAKPKPPAPGPIANAPVPPPATAKPGPLAIPFTLPGGTTCRTWDDFLTIAAQRWELLRDELTSGRLAGHLKKAERPDLIPIADPSQSADEQLDHWLGRLPTTKPSGPELDVHPTRLVIRTAARGGTLQRSLQVANVGYRLLRASIRVEPSSGGRVRLAASSPAVPFLVIDQEDVPIEIDLPESSNASQATLGTVVVESNGGSRRVEVRLERPPAGETIPESTATAAQPIDLAAWGRPLGERIADMPLIHRLIFIPLIFVCFRMLIVLAGVLPFLNPNGAGHEARLGAIATVLSIVGLLVGAAWGMRSGEGGVLPCGLLGAMAGLLASAVGFAAVNSVESLLGPWAGSPVATVAFWAILGLLIALASWLALPASHAITSREMEPT